MVDETLHSPPHGHRVSAEGFICMNYHVRRTDRQIEDEATLEGILLQGKCATLALCRGGGPYVVTLSYGCDRSARALYFQEG